MQEIKIIDLDLTNQFKRLELLIEKIELNVIAEFEIGGSDSDIPWDSLNYAGVYLIEIENDGKSNDFNDWITKFKEKWEGKEHIIKYSPSLKIKRIKQHSELEDWIPLYIGKSKKIGNRICEHIFLESDRATFALKLGARQNLKDSRFRLKTYRIGVMNYDAILPRIELHLRNRINPLIGRQ